MRDSGGKPAATSGCSLPRRDVYGFLFSVRRVFMNRSPCHSPAARFVLGQLMCYGGEATRTEKEPVVHMRAAETLLAHLKPEDPFVWTKYVLLISPGINACDN